MSFLTLFAAPMRHKLLWWASAVFMVLAASTASAGPGAHGPNGEHLDEHAPVAARGAAAPRFEARSDAFELVGRLTGGELSLLIDRFETNEPVLGAKIEVEVAGLRAGAAFHADHGDYSVTDPKLLDVLAQPGQHPIVITVVAAAGETDLLDATLETVGQIAEHPHDHTTERVRWAAAALATALVGGSVGWLVRRRAARRTERAGA